MNLENITDKIFHLNFPNQYLLASTFHRFQEHYESPKFRGKIFTLEEYMDWYASEKGNFTYFEDWAGFNIPSYVLQPFYDGKFDPLLDKEKKLLSLFKKKEGIFYIIGTFGDKNQSTLKHEIAHGLFYTVPDYKKDVLALLSTVDTRKIRRELMKDCGYCKEVLYDETHAYLLGSLSDWRKKRIINKSHEDIKMSLENIYQKYYNLETKK